MWPVREHLASVAILTVAGQTVDGLACHEEVTTAMVTDDNERFRVRYATSGDAALLAAEAEALGTDYRANGYTTMAQAAEIARELMLEPGQLLVDIGAGCGWPGLYLAAKHSCAVISLDPVVEGVEVGKQRIAADGLGELVWPVCASGDALPLRSRSVDAVIHVDVLC